MHGYYIRLTILGLKPTSRISHTHTHTHRVKVPRSPTHISHTCVQPCDIGIKIEEGTLWHGGSGYDD